METRHNHNLDAPGSVSTDTEHEPNFLLVRDNSGDWPRWKRAAVGSAIFHVIAITLLFLIKGGSSGPPPLESQRVPYVAHLYFPKELTQKAPNNGPVAKLLLSTPAAPAPKIAEPARPKTAPAAAPPPAPTPKPVPVPPPPAPVAPPAATPGETARNQPPASTPPPVAIAKPDAPKIIVDDSLQARPPAPRPGGSLTAPSDPVQEAMRSLGNNGTAAGTHVGESEEISVGAGLHLPAGAARTTLPQLKSDPMGVDWQPYLQQVLARVKLNWGAVFPTAAKLGSRGIVTLEFAISKDGTVQKIVFDGQSNSRPLDNASVAAISASNPMPPLPKDFKGDRIVLQMSFMYNMPR
jgi:TonB family protein